MNYPLKRTAPFEDDIDLLDESSNVVKTIHLSLDLETIMGRYTAALGHLMQAGEAADPRNPASLSMYGGCVVEFLKVIFGDDTDAILAHYEGRYMDLLEQVLPYIYRRIGQQVQAITQGRIDAMKEARRAETV